MKAIVRQVRISPKKANLVAGLVRRKSVNDAVDILKFTPKKAANILRKAIESAAANGENNFNQSKKDLYIKEIVVTKGVTFKRGVPVSKGRVHPILKRNSHITVKLDTLITAEEPKPAKSKTAKVEKSEKTAEAKVKKSTKTTK